MQASVGQSQGRRATVIVVTVKTGSVGITLTAASRVYLFEPMLDPAEEQQASANDECADATLIDPNSVTEFDTAGATESTEPYIPSQCTGTYFTATGPDIWFRMNLESAGKLLLTSEKGGVVGPRCI